MNRYCECGHSLGYHVVAGDDGYGQCGYGRGCTCASFSDPFGTSCVECGEAIDDVRAYVANDEGDLMHVGCIEAS